MSDPSPAQLAAIVLIGAWDTILTVWTPAIGCPAWVDSANRRCGKVPTAGYLCARHEAVARRRWDKQAKKRSEQQAAETITRKARRELNLPHWQAEIARVEAEINRLDPPPATTDRAAYGGNIHPSITRRQQGLMSDAKVEKMADLTRRHEQLTRLIDTDA